MVVVMGCSAGESGAGEGGSAPAYQACESQCLGWGACALASGCACDSSGCTSGGYPSSEDDCCIAVRVGDCYDSEWCAAFGRCSLDGTVCAALWDSDCAGSEVCVQQGFCSACDGVCRSDCGR